MDKDIVQYGYALIDESQQVVAIDQIDREKSQRHSFYCPNCREKMYPTFGQKYVHHFRHIGQKCQYSNYLHNLAKTVFKQEFESCRKDNTPFLLELHAPTKCDRDCLAKSKKECKKYDKVTVDLAKLYSSVTLVQTLFVDAHSRRPDILLKSDDGQQLWIEIWVSHETSLDKRDDGPIVELKISSENDLKQFRNHHITQSEENELSVRYFNVEFSDSQDAVQISKHKYQNCHDYIGRPPRVRETHIHSYNEHKQTSIYDQKYIPPVKVTYQEPIVSFSHSREWVDLGLPSGTLWAKTDVETHITFNSAISGYYKNVPSIKQADELKRFTTREWNSETKTIIMKGPNGNSITFYCQNDDTPFWLNTSERDIMGRNEFFGHCYHLGKDKHFDINDKSVNSYISLHLVKE
jgi:hypothetical protein